MLSTINYELSALKRVGQMYFRSIARHYSFVQVLYIETPYGVNVAILSQIP